MILFNEGHYLMDHKNDFDWVFLDKSWDLLEAIILFNILVSCLTFRLYVACWNVQLSSEEINHGEL